MNRHGFSLLAALGLLCGAFAPAPAQRPAAPEPIQKVEVRADRAFLVNGKPFFPLFAWLQDARNFPMLKECGMNATAGALPRTSGVANVAGYLELVRQAGLYGIVPYEAGMKGSPALLGYIHGDEPDLTHNENGRKAVKRQPAETLKDYQAIKAADPTRPVFMTLTAHFMPAFRKADEAFLEPLYPDYIKSTDVVGFDIYPIYGWNKPQWLHRVYDGAAQLTQMAGGRPVYAWIETSRGGQFTGPLERQHEVTPAHIKAEVWESICAGATAIGYFTHIWKPGYKQFGVPLENRRALREINDQITRLTPEILGARPRRAVTLSAEGGAQVAMMAKETSGTLSIFTVRYDTAGTTAPAAATIKVEGLPAGEEVFVVDEGRKLKGEAGEFKDQFEPLAVHIYQIKGAL